MPPMTDAQMSKTLVTVTKVVSDESPSRHVVHGSDKGSSTSNDNAFARKQKFARFSRLLKATVPIAMKKYLNADWLNAHAIANVLLENDYTQNTNVENDDLGDLATILSCALDETWEPVISMFEDNGHRIWCEVTVNFAILRMITLVLICISCAL